MRIIKVSGSLAGQQAAWVAAIDPWRSLGYDTAPLRRWLARMAREGNVLAAVRAPSSVVGLVVVVPQVLLGNFIALLAVRPEAAAEGMGRALVARVERNTFRRHRWLYVSSDAANTNAARFYRTLGFVRVGRLPNMIRPGRSEILWRKGRD